MIPRILLFAVMICQLMASGCALIAVGAVSTGAGVGIYTYMEGEVIRLHQGEHEESVQAVLAALQDLGISVKDKMSHEFGNVTVIKADRKDGIPVRITIRTETVKVNEIRIRCGYTGIWDKQTSEQIHAAIDRRLRG